MFVFCQAFSTPVSAIALLVAAIAIAQPVHAASEPPQSASAELYMQGHKAYDAEKYESAAQAYQQLINSGVTHGDIYYNLGNACLRAGSLGKAVAAYLRATRLSPRDQDLQANLTFARKNTKDDILYARSPIIKTLFFWHYTLSRTEALMALLMGNLLFWLLAIGRIYLPAQANLAWIRNGTLLITLALGVSWSIRTLSPALIAVIQEQEVSVHSGTNTETVVRFIVHEGSELQVVSQEADWVRIALPDGTQGWIQQKEVDVVAL